MAGDVKHKRRNYFINKRFQLKYTMSIAATIAVIMLASGAGLYMGMWGSIIENFSKFRVSENLENAKRITDYEEARYKRGDYRLERIFREAELLSDKEKETLETALISVNRSLVPKVLMLIILISLGAILVSHRIAGPMYRIERSAEAIRDGNLSVNFYTRKSDDMKEATSALEGMVESLHDDMKRLKAASVNLDERISGMAGRVSAEDAQKLRAIIAEIDSILAKYKT